MRGGEQRTQSFAYVFDVLAVLTVEHVAREEMQTGIEAYRKQRGRPVGSDKEQPPFDSTATFSPPFVLLAPAGKRE